MFYKVSLQNLNSTKINFVLKKTLKVLHFALDGVLFFELTQTMFEDLLPKIRNVKKKICYKKNVKS